MERAHLPPKVTAAPGRQRRRIMAGYPVHPRAPASDYAGSRPSLDARFGHVIRYISAPRGALPYPPCSGERLEGISLDLMAYPASKG